MDFEAMIREAQKNGLTIDDIAKTFSKTLNAIQKEEQKKDARVELIKHMKNQFEASKNTDAAALYAIIMAEKHPDWTAKDINNYFQIIKLNAETAATMIGKEPDDIFQMSLDKIAKLFNIGPKSKDSEKIFDFLREIGL